MSSVARKGNARRRRRWRFYESLSGDRPVRGFLDALPQGEAAKVVAVMKHVAYEGLKVGRHLRGDIWEVRVDGENRIYRVLFSVEGRSGHVLLALEGFTKKTQRTPPKTIRLAERRLADWRARGKSRKKR